jgi:hypothetical protein
MSIRLTICNALQQRKSVRLNLTRLGRKWQRQRGRRSHNSENLGALASEAADANADRLPILLATSVSRIGDSASVQAVTRVNAEEALYEAFEVKHYLTA